MLSFLFVNISLSEFGEVLLPNSNKMGDPAINPVNGYIFHPRTQECLKNLGFPRSNPMTVWDGMFRPSTPT